MKKPIDCKHLDEWLLCKKSKEERTFKSVATIIRNVLTARTTNQKRRKKMETADYCDYNLSKKLKECGFDWECDTFYNGHGALCQYATTDRVNRNTNGHHTLSCAAPTLWQAQKWMREAKKIDVLVCNCACGYLWEVAKVNSDTTLILFDENGDDKDSGCWTTYEAALSAGLAAALELLRKEVAK